MGIKRVVDTDFWEDDKVMLMFSPEDKLFFLYLMTNPHATQIGIYKILTKQMAFELGYSLDTVDVLLDRFENKYGVIKYSKTTKELAIRNYLRYSVIKGGKPVLDLLIREAKAVKDKRLLSYIKSGAELSENETVKYFISNNLNDNDNDNDNDDSYHESYNESYDESYNESYDESYHESLEEKTEKKSYAKPKKHKYGEYKNVLLSDEELEKLKAEFPNSWSEWIERVSSYVASTGKSYKNYLAVIRTWSRSDKKETKYSDSDEDEAFKNALERSYGR